MSLQHAVVAGCSRPDWEGLQGRLSSDSITIVEGIFEQATSANTAFLGTTNSKQFYDRADTLLSALSMADFRLCQHAVGRLAGLGVGLTPAGDDFLMGVLYALWAVWSEAEASWWGEMIARTAAPLTTSLSAAWLLAAAQGGAALPWHDLVDGLADGAVSTIQQAARQILATGHTSGAAALAGFVDTIKVLFSTAQ